MAKTEHTSKTDIQPDTHEWERDGQNASLWNKHLTLKNEETALPATEVYDVIVVGVGITGLTTALLLQQAGNQCILVDAHHVHDFGQESSGRYPAAQRVVLVFV